MATAAENLASIEAAIAATAGSAAVAEVQIDGMRTKYDHKTLIFLRDYWKQQVALAASTKPRLSRIDLSRGNS